MAILTEQEVKQLFLMRPEIEMEKRMREAYWYRRADEMPPSDRLRLETLDRQLLMIDALMAVLTRDEAFVVQTHLIEGLDWSRAILEYNKRWGSDMEKTIRAMQICLRKALQKVAITINKRIDFEWHNFK